MIFYKNILSNIYSYSFSIDKNEEYQPSGSCNMTSIADVKINIETITPPKYSDTFMIDDPESDILLSDDLYRFDICIYIINYNILEINNGFSTLLFKY